MGKYFGTDGFRGEANVQLTVDNAFKVGRLRTARMGIFPRFLSRIWWLPSVTPEFRLPSLIPQAHSCAIS